MQIESKLHTRSENQTMRRAPKMEYPKRISLFNPSAFTDPDIATSALAHPDRDHTHQANFGIVRFGEDCSSSGDLRDVALRLKRVCSVEDFGLNLEEESARYFNSP